MKRFKKTSLIIIALVLVAGLIWLVWLVSRPHKTDDKVAESILDTSQSPSFQVRVVVPRMSRPFGGILPDWVVRKLDATPSELRFDHTSRGAQIVSVRNDRVQLKADDWDFFIETDSEGRILPSTRLVFPLALGGRHLRLNCGPANPANGHLEIVKMLVAHGADLDARTDDGKNALDFAAERKHEEVARYLGGLGLAS